MLEKDQIITAIIIMILLTIIIYGIGKSVVKMSFGNVEIPQKEDILQKLNLAMYLPQVTLITGALVLGIYMPPYINQIINNAVLAVSSL